MLQIIRTIFTSFLISGSIYMLTVVFKWNFYNPLYWINNVPNWHGGERIALLVFIPLYSISNYYLQKGLYEKSENKMDHIGGAIGLYTICALLIGVMNCGC